MNPRPIAIALCCAVVLVATAYFYQSNRRTPAKMIELREGKKP